MPERRQHDLPTQGRFPQLHVKPDIGDDAQHQPDKVDPQILQHRSCALTSPSGDHHDGSAYRVTGHHLPDPRTMGRVDAPRHYSGALHGQFGRQDGGWLTFRW